MSAAEAAGLFGPGSVSWRVDRELIVSAVRFAPPARQAERRAASAGGINAAGAQNDPDAQADPLYVPRRAAANVGD